MSVLLQYNIYHSGLSFVGTPDVTSRMSDYYVPQRHGAALILIFCKRV